MKFNSIAMMMKRNISSELPKMSYISSILLELTEMRLDYSTVKLHFDQAGVTNYQILKADMHTRENPDNKMIIIDNVSTNLLKKSLSSLENNGIITKEWSSTIIPWFPKTYKDLESQDYKTVTFGTGLEEAENASFKDKEYRKRRDEIIAIGNSFKISDKVVPNINYLNIENETWEIVRNSLTPLHKKYACKEYNDSVGEMDNYCKL